MTEGWRGKMTGEDYTAGKQILQNKIIIDVEV